VQFRVYASPDKVEQTEYALNISVQILARYEELFGLPYPLPKLGTLSRDQRVWVFVTCNLASSQRMVLRSRL